MAQISTLKSTNNYCAICEKISVIRVQIKINCTNSNTKNTNNLL